MKNPIIIDDEFKSLIPPMSADSLAQLEANIRAEGLRHKIIVMDTLDGFVVVDGHHRFQVMKKLAAAEPEAFGTFRETVQAKQTTKSPDRWSVSRYNDYFEMAPFFRDSDREAVKLWILQNQIGRRNLTKEQRVEMVARIVVLRQEQTAKVQVANLKQGDAIPEVPEVVPSGKKTVRAAAKEFNVSRKPLQQAVTAIKDNQPKPTECDICQQPFESKGAMRDHRKKEHAEEMAQRNIPTERNPWDALNKRLSPFLPLEGDGTENTVPSLLQSLTQGEIPEEDAAVAEHAVYLLETISKQFADYAADIKRRIRINLARVA